jgi:hypothetical protein
MIKKKLLLLLLLASLAGFSQGPKLSPNTQISIFTCGRGEELYSTFGHTALRIKDSENELDVVYNYGYFDFRTDNFYFKFVKGDLQYFMNVTSYEDFIFEYQTDKREVVEQTLNLPLEKKQQLFNALNSALLSSEKFYTYKFIDRNCTSMIVDKINGVLGKKEIEKVDDKSISYRKLLYPYFEDFFWYKLGINIIFGAKTDAKAEKLFLPVELENSLDKATIDGKPLVSKKEIVVNEDKTQHAFSILNSIYLICTLLLILLVINKRFLLVSYLFVAGILGVFLCVVGFYSEHQELLWNYNALLFNPLFILIPFVKNSFLKKVTITLLLMLLIYCIMMVTKPHLVIMLPFIITNLYILLKLNGSNPFKLLTSVK